VSKICGEIREKRRGGEWKQGSQKRGEKGDQKAQRMFLSKRRALKGRKKKKNQGKRADDVNGEERTLNDRLQSRQRKNVSGKIDRAVKSLKNVFKKREGEEGILSKREAETEVPKGGNYMSTIEGSPGKKKVQRP